MLQFRLILLGVSVVAGIGYAIYTHYQNQERSHQRQHSYGPPPRSPEDNTVPPQQPSASNSNNRQRKRKYTSKDMVCSICLVNIHTWSPDATTLDCGHGFHEHCIKVWLNSNKTCPNCRATA